MEDNGMGDALLGPTQLRELKTLRHVPSQVSTGSDLVLLFKEHQGVWVSPLSLGHILVT